MNARVVSLLVLTSLAGCRPFDDTLAQTLRRLDAGDPDAGSSDAGLPDAGSSDGGAPDAGTPDAGTPDAGTPDAGTPDAGQPDAGEPDAGIDAGPRCVLGPSFSEPSLITLSATAGPAVGSILNGFLVAAPRPSSTVALMKFDGTLFSSASDMGCSGACIGVRLPRVISTNGPWAGLTWSSAATTLHEVAPGAVPIAGNNSSNSCVTTLNGDALHGPDASVQVSGCDQGFSLRRGTTTVNGSSNTREVRASQNENKEAWLAYATNTSVVVARIDEASLQPDNANPVQLELLSSMGFDVAPDGRWFLSGVNVVGAAQLYFGTVDGGAERLPLPSATFPVVSVTAPLGLAANESFMLLTFQANPQGVFVMPYARDAGWQPAIRVSTSGARPAIAVDRTGFLVVWVEQDQLKVAPLTCQ